MKNYLEVKNRIRKDILQIVQSERIDTIEDSFIREKIDDAIIRESKEQFFSLEERRIMGKQIFFELRRLHVVQELLDEEEITEIMINGTEGIFYEKAGEINLWVKKIEKREILEDIIQRIVAGCNRVVNEANPIVDARLTDGSRVNIILPPVALNGPIVTIRKFSRKPMTMKDLLTYRAISTEASEFLKKLIIAGYNILISGGTGSGKTTFLNALSQWIPREERVITIEDSAELQLNDLPNLVKLETRNANVEGCDPISMRSLIKASLRMRPDRIIVGEVRGEEAVDMIQAMNTGHDGSLSTAHANTATDALSRIETMMIMGNNIPLQAIRRQIVSGIDVIIQLGRMRDHSRKVLEIVELIGLSSGEYQIKILFKFEERNCGERTRGELVKKSEISQVEKLQNAGMLWGEKI